MSFQQGLSGLNAANSNLAAIGNNVANANTVGFKQSTAQFADMFAASLSGVGSGQVGTGVSVSAVAQQYTQGNITATTNPMDNAISGQGFFQMTTTGGGTVYSRNGQFQLDKNGFMVNAQGNKVNGYMPNAAGVILAGAVVPLQINPANLQPKPSAIATVGVNLNSAAPVPANSVFSPTDPASYTNSTSMSVYDSLGASHVGTLYFQRLPVAPISSAAIIPAAATTMTVASSAGLSVGNSITIPGAGAAGPATTIPGATAAGVTSVTLTSTAGMAVGDNITIPGAGAAGPVPTVDVAPAATATSVPLVSVTGLSAGTNITIGGSTATIASIAPGIAPAGTVTLAAPGLAAAPAPGAAGTSALPLVTTITNIIGNVVTFAAPTANPTIAGAAITSTLPLTATISSIAGNVLTFTPPTTTATLANAAIASNAPSSNWNTYLTVDGASVPATPATTVPSTTSIGATSATLASVTGLAVGSAITIAGNPGAVTITGIAGNVVTFAPATTAATLAGAVVNVPGSVVTPLTQLSFNTLGALTLTTPATTPVGTVVSSALFPTSTSVSPTQTVSFNFNSPTAGTTQFGSTFGVNTLTQDGYASGQLNSTSTGADGTITGHYSNGQTRPLGQIVLANFTGLQGLQSIGNNAWVQTAASGQALVGAPGSGSLGSLQSSATEDSNVDLTAALVNMITAQRVYQANAQTIKTQDQLLQTIVNLR